ncbi:MAG TPA: L-aspartate oxidase [Alphaproteobacteria bacterium]|nr:L-aspartate oxidase [Alphaproteobacteria bacterium]
MNDIASFSHRPVIIGSGLAGLSVALALSPRPVILLAAARIGEQSSSILAQGGIAASLGTDDNAALHAEDTITAGAGLCDPAIVKAVTEDAASVIENLRARGVVFDAEAEGRLKLGLEGAHGKRRIVHAGGDGTGRAIMTALGKAVRATPSIAVIENAVATDLLTDTHGAIAGVAFLRDGERQAIETGCAVLATGGAGALWLHTTNPHGSWGHGLALAARAGAVLADLEFMQFHPTAIDAARDPMPLASEALRGEGATLIDETGARFMQDFPRRELEPRDVVAHAIWRHMGEEHKVFLDARAALGADFARRFPSIHALCLETGIDPATMPIPVRPAAHYHMGGVKTDAQGRTSVEGLWACGEVAATGLHGANRLASNSLLEAASFGRRVAGDIRGFEKNLCGIRYPAFGKKSSRPLVAADDRAQIRAIMSTHLGVVRDGAGLEEAVRRLMPLADRSDMALAGLTIAAAALRREESRGAHCRRDFPRTESAAQSSLLTLDETLAFAQQFAQPASRAARF